MEKFGSGLWIDGYGWITTSINIINQWAYLHDCSLVFEAVERTDVDPHSVNSLYTKIFFFKCTKENLFYKS
jgi:hypothetical protein